MTPQIVKLNRGFYWVGSKHLLHGPFATSHDALVDWEKNSPSDLITKSNEISQRVKLEDNTQLPLFNNDEQLIEDIFHTYRNVDEGIGVEL